MPLTVVVVNSINNQSKQSIRFVDNHWGKGSLCGHNGLILNKEWLPHWLPPMVPAFLLHLSIIPKLKDSSYLQKCLTQGIISKLNSILYQTFEKFIIIYRFYCWNSHWYYKLKLLKRAIACFLTGYHSIKVVNYLGCSFHFLNVANNIGQFCDVYLICTLNKNIITKV